MIDLKSMFVAIILFVLLAPMLTLVHEFGHACLPLLRNEKVSISVGVGPSVKLAVGNLNVSLGLLKPWIGTANWQSEDSVANLLFGPLASLFLGLGFIYFVRTQNSSSPLLYAFAGYCLFQFLFTILPITYPTWLGYEENMVSDGKKILEILKIANN